MCGEHGRTEVDYSQAGWKGSTRKTNAQQTSGPAKYSTVASTSAGACVPAMAMTVAQGRASRARLATAEKLSVSHQGGNVGSSRRKKKLQEHLDMCLKKLKVMRTELVGSESYGPPEDDGVNKKCNHKLGGRISLEDVSIGGGLDVEKLKYHRAANIVVLGGQMLEPLTLNAVLDSCSGVKGISECLLMKWLHAHFGGVQVSRLLPGGCIVSVADGREFPRQRCRCWRETPMLAFEIRLHSQLFASSQCIVAYQHKIMLCSKYNNTSMYMF